MKQELEFCLFKLSTNEKVINAKNINSYIFISLKNKAIEYMKREFKINSHLVKKDEFVIDNIEFKHALHQKKDLMDYIREIIRLNNIDNLIKSNCDEDECKIITEYFFEKKSQKEIAKNMKISQQALSKKLTNIRIKLKPIFNDILEKLKNSDYY